LLADFLLFFCTFAPMQKYQKISTQKEGMAHSGKAKRKKANFDKDK